MARVLRWLAVCAFASIPFVIFFGRTRSVGCVGTRVICDPRLLTPDWAVPAFFIALGSGIVLLISAAAWSRGASDLVSER